MYINISELDRSKVQTFFGGIDQTDLNSMSQLVVSMLTPLARGRFDDTFSPLGSLSREDKVCWP